MDNSALPTWVTLALAPGFLLSLYVGARLILLARQTRELPELALGTAGLSAALGNLGLVQSLRLEGSDAGLAVGAVCLAVVILGSSAFLVAVARIFRPESRWVLAVPAVGIAALAVGWYGRVFVDGRPAGVYEASVFNLLLILGRALPYVWWAGESVAYNAMLRKRIAVGLADPWLAHRFALWAWQGLFVTIALGILLVMAFVLRQDLPSSPLAITLLALATLGTNIAGYLAFFPPDVYRRLFDEEPAPA